MLPAQQMQLVLSNIHHLLYHERLLVLYRMIDRCMDCNLVVLMTCFIFICCVYFVGYAGVYVCVNYAILSTSEDERYIDVTSALTFLGIVPKVKQHWKCINSTPLPHSKIISANINIPNFLKILHAVFAKSCAC